MNIVKTSNPVRLIAFFLTAAILTLTFGFTVDGWGINVDQKGTHENVEVAKKDDVIFEPPQDDSTEITPEIIIPEFINRLTGLETTKEISGNTPLAFIMDGVNNVYGISRSDLLVEIPIENEETRLISFISDTNDLWKIGSIASGRGYINNITKYFGAITVFNGCDDSIRYDYCNIGKSDIDLSLKEGFSYTEFSSKMYTNCQLIDAGKTSYGTVEISADENALPFAFNSFGNKQIKFDNVSIRIEAVLNKDCILKLLYDNQSQRYSYTRNGKPINDLLNGNTLDFTNCFILFCDSVTYDNYDGCQLVMNTVGNGVGYYITEGSYTEIKWNASISGSLNFYLPTGEKLTINRGNSYICYLKSSKINNISFS